MWKRYISRETFPFMSSPGQSSLAFFFRLVNTAYALVKLKNILDSASPHCSLYCLGRVVQAIFQVDQRVRITYSEK